MQKAYGLGTPILKSHKYLPDEKSSHRMSYSTFMKHRYSNHTPGVEDHYGNKESALPLLASYSDRATVDSARAASMQRATASMRPKLLMKTRMQFQYD